MQMKGLDLFAGSLSVSRVAESMGMETFSVELEPYEGISWQGDILDLKRSDIPFTPDWIWASPVCTTYSIAAISHHRNGTEPRSAYAKYSDMMLEKTLEIISWFPESKFFIENPMGMMRKMPILKGIHRAEVTYCSYGDTRMKPTDIFTNHAWSIFNPNGWMARDKCFNGNVNCQHQPAPRGSRTGTQGLKGSYERSRIPSDLVREILESVMPKMFVPEWIERGNEDHNDNS